MAFNLVLDEPDNTDRVEEHEGINFIASEDLINMCEGFTFSLSPFGLQIKADNESAENGCGSCSGCQ